MREVREGLAMLIGGTPGFHCAGSYRSAAAYLHKLQQTCRDTGVTGFELSDNLSDSAVSGTASPSASFSLQLVWYVQPTTSK